VPPVDVELPAEASSAAAARAVVRALLMGVGEQDPDQQAIDRVLLLTSEVVTNAILHARTPLRLTASVDDGEVVVRVYDSVASLPRRREYLPDAGTGRGLHLVEELADSWGVDQTAGGKSVWFAVAVVSGEQAASLG
jgi:anti-sigma regulatory factor (Ser/Thr protein kinase)